MDEIVDIGIEIRMYETIIYISSRKPNIPTIRIYASISRLGLNKLKSADRLFSRIKRSGVVFRLSASTENNIKTLFSTERNKVIEFLDDRRYR